MKSTSPDLQLDPRGLPPTQRIHRWFSALSMDAGTPHPAPPPALHATRTVWAALALLTLYVAFGLTPVGSSLDQSMRAARDDSGTALVWLSQHLLDAVNALTVTTTTLALTVVAWRRAGRASGVLTVLGIAAALGLAEAMKTVLPTVSHGPGDLLVVGGSFPSGHVAVTTAVVLAALSVAGPRLMKVLWLPAVVLPGVTAVATIAVGWHRPSDAIGGVLAAVVAHHGVRALAPRLAPRLSRTPRRGTGSQPGTYGAGTGRGDRPLPLAAVRRRGPSRRARAALVSSGALLATAYLGVLSRSSGSPGSWHEPGVLLYAGALGGVLITAQALMTGEVHDP
ncbi:MAG: phosphatase PAP2 family protein [Terracoccus sp.]